LNPGPKTCPSIVPQPSQANAGRIPSLDGLRGIAILLVLIGHASYSLPQAMAPVLRFAGNGALGVNIFFVLSGYLIYQLSVREADRTGGFNWRQFYLRRVLRIFPCFYFYIAVLLALVGLGVFEIHWPALVAAATFSQNYRHLWDVGERGPSDDFVIGHYWTLALEEQFYLTWPLLMLLFRKNWLFPTLIAILALAPLFRIATYQLMPGSRGQLGMMFHTGFDSIAAGVLLGELTRGPRAGPWLTALAGKWWLSGIAIAYPLLIARPLAGSLGGAYSHSIGKSIELACICLVISAAVSQRDSLLFRFLNWKSLAYVGVLSYSLYIWNNLFLYEAGIASLNYFPVNIVCVFGMAIFSHYLIEKPFLKLKDRFHKPAR
jgi:peptidoglycan/LPS O-acetylase OafA/YrhL